MLALMGAVAVLLIVWAVYEIRGIVSPQGEDTYSEWFFDLPLWALIPLSILHLTAGILFVWSSLHFVEGWIRRRQHENDE